MKAIAFVIICACGLTLSVRTIFWNREDVQIYRQAADDPNKVECCRVQKTDLLKLMFRDWLKNDANSPADLWPDGKIDMKDFGELSKNWRK